LSDSGDEYTGETKSEFLDLNWKAVGGREGNITAKRLKAPEKPPEYNDTAPVGERYRQGETIIYRVCRVDNYQVVTIG
jgi:hypothetical protein